MTYRVLVAMDKFKGTLRSGEAAEIISSGLSQALGDRVSVRAMGLADGGEGTCEALTAARGGSYRKVRVRGPLGAPVDACYGYSGDCAFMEMASCCGLGLLSPEERNPLLTSTYGFGEMLLDAVSHGAREIIAGIGGSGTNDGGAGMAEALGVVFRDASGAVLTGLCGGRLGEVCSVDRSGLSSVLGGVRLRIASDVRNPLLGRLGASRVYGPQKGATAAMVGALESGLRHLREVCDPSCPSEGVSGDGAAGGLGFGCRVFCGAEFESGARLVMEESGFCSLLSSGSIDLVVTGEGCTDSQTGEGKLCSEVSRHARGMGIPCVLLSGGLGCSRGELLGDYDGVFVSGVGRGDLSGLLSHAREDLFSASVSVGMLLRSVLLRAHGMD